MEPTRKKAAPVQRYVGEGGDTPRKPGSRDAPDQRAAKADRPALSASPPGELEASDLTALTLHAAGLNIRQQVQLRDLSVGVRGDGSPQSRRGPAASPLRDARLGCAEMIRHALGSPALGGKPVV